MTAADVPADVTAALEAVRAAQTPSPDRLYLPVSTFWRVLAYPEIALLHRARRKRGLRRPLRFTRRLGYGWPCP